MTSGDEQCPASSVRGLILTCGLAAMAGDCTGQEHAWRPGERIPGRLAAFASDPRDIGEVAGFFRQLGLHVIGTGSLTGLVYVQCAPGDEQIFADIARMHPLVRGAGVDRVGYPAFNVPPSEMPPPTGEPTGPYQTHDLYFLENTGQTIPENSYGASTSPISGTPGADINALGAWTISQGSSSVWVAVFDSGVDFNHPEFAGRLHATGYALTCPGGSFNPEHCCSGTPLICNFGNATDNHGHASAATSVLGANVDNGTPSVLNGQQYAGIDPSCSIFPVRISWNNGPSVQGTLLALEEIYFNDSGGFDVQPRVINLSYSFGRENPNDTTLIALKFALDTLKYNDFIVVNSAMNGGDGEADLLVPAAWNNTITVAGTDPNDERLHLDNGAWFSSSGTSVDFAAPGWGMSAAICPTTSGCSTLFQDGYYSGTSASAPIVSGIVTLLLARADALNISLTWDDVYEALKDGAVPLGDPPYPNEEFGWGRVDAYQSLQSL